MIKHVVLFRFKDDIAAEDRKNAFESFRSGIMSLVKIIPVIRKIEVGYNVNSQESWDICLCGEFESMEDVVAYSTHPEHLKVSGALKPLLSGRSCVDYEVTAS